MTPFLLIATLLIPVSTAGTIVEEFKNSGIIPDVINEPPLEQLGVTFGTLDVNLGNELTPTQVKDQPMVNWTADPNKLYVLAMTDPDNPGPKGPEGEREWHHWLVGNIQGNLIETGEVLSAFIGSGPPKNSGLHRYVFLVYEQPGPGGTLTFDEPRLNNNSTYNRAMFSIQKFADKYFLGKPIAGNFYKAQWDNYVDVFFPKLTNN